MEIVLRSLIKVQVSDKRKWVEILKYSSGKRGLCLRGREWHRRGEAAVRLDEARNGFGPCTLQYPRRVAKPYDSCDRASP